jgi:hypothetical protein
MPAEESKPPPERFPLSLTEAERETMIHTTRLKPAIKARLADAAPGTQVVRFTERELEYMSVKVDKAIYFVPEPYKQRLDSALGKICDILDTLDGIPIGEDRKKPVRSGKIFQFKVTLKDSHPRVWRRIQVPDGTLRQFHEILQAAMGWTGSHLHLFTVLDAYYGVPLDAHLPVSNGIHDEATLLISQIASAGRMVPFRYEYDLSEGWLHEVELERVLVPETKVGYPRCMDGDHACPPEDCGGIRGYAHLLDVLGDPEHPEHAAMKKWVGSEFHPEKFSVEVVNKKLQWL